jgi:hypothetical protein
MALTSRYDLGEDTLYLAADMTKRERRALNLPADAKHHVRLQNFQNMQAADVAAFCVVAASQLNCGAEEVRLAIMQAIGEVGFAGVTRH